MPSPKPPSVESLPLRSIHPDSTATGSPLEPLQPTRGKRKRECKDEKLDKRPQDCSQGVAELPPSKDLLNWENLEKLNSETASEICEWMAEEKETVSRRSSTAEMNQDTASVSSQKTSLSLCNYRLNSLDRARIVFQHRCIPEHLEHRVNAIVQPKLDKEREKLVFAIADDLCNDFPDVLEVASGEDDCAELIYQALEAMNRQLFGKAFAFRRKAGPSGTPALKPMVQRKSYRSGAPHKSLNDMGFSDDRPNKRRQAETSYVSPGSAEITMPPPPSPPPMLDNNCVKNARPDITIGFLHAVVAKKLVSLGANKLDAEEILKDLQYEQELLSSPTLPALHIRFPSMVVEGKSYATGKSMYEAENQAAGSGSCMLVMQGRLAELTARRSPGTDQGKKDPLASSITHEGPILLLWLHYTTSLENACFYNLHVLSVCHATIRSTTREFFRALAGVMGWASTELLDDVAAQLVLIWKSTQTQKKQTV
ncbi:hypothetical protein Z517_05087 [Fonsecaea pedrosoi CBS 271.37]|uniref:DUF7924 domain-containing protein n=1 Tax=Fonsecaea pedrosoi CBS 271.37 TaxID=1442368 RepID=A0A0D2GU28_9EURO|nr:uncharacterized protein Z517_05087 [Fonsecaea pedrosoi CBS 271.37]KIW82060.1 hypothetical protein Z517_05087 [Fonsecaea pedrosoi CBS 271.37]